VPSTDDPEWLSTAAAARHLGVTPRTLYRLIDKGELPASS
jgi:excisionase family DNA binding protein